MRVNGNNIRMDCNVKLPEYGIGRNTGKIAVQPIGTGANGVTGLPHGSVRGWGSVPYGFDFDVNYCRISNNFCKQWDGSA